MKPKPEGGREEEGGVVHQPDISFFVASPFFFAAGWAPERFDTNASNEAILRELECPVCMCIVKNAVQCRLREKEGKKESRKRKRRKRNEKEKACS